MSGNKPYFPLPSEGVHSRDGEATATCYCGAVQLAFPTGGKTFPFVCNCTDCRKITASMFAANFIVEDKHLKHLRGQEKLVKYSSNKTVESGNTMTDSFCSVCGTTMYRNSSGSPGFTVLRLGTVDDFTLHETTLKPRMEHYTKDRVAWLHGAEAVKQVSGSFFINRKSKI